MKIRRCSRGHVGLATSRVSTYVAVFAADFHVIAQVQRPAVTRGRAT